MTEAVSDTHSNSMMKKVPLFSSMIKRSLPLTEAIYCKGHCRQAACKPVCTQCNALQGCIAGRLPASQPACSAVHCKGPLQGDTVILKIQKKNIVQKTSYLNESALKCS
jgi:hypothetical protein